MPNDEGQERAFKPGHCESHIENERVGRVEQLHGDVNVGKSLHDVQLEASEMPAADDAPKVDAPENFPQHVFVEQSLAR